MNGTLEDALRGGPATERAEGAEELRTAFVERAGSGRLIDVAYATVDSPLGPLVVAATGKGLVTLHYGNGADVVDELAATLSPRLLHAPARLDPIRRELDEYFDGKRRRFDFKIDRRLMGPFQRKVLRATKAIPFGSVATYHDVATKAGAPRGSRAAGNALGANPIPIVVPCHRVVRTGGGLGGYTGGLHRKEFLLELEGVEV